MKSSNFSAFPLLSGHTGFLEGSDVFWWGNKWAQLYLLNLRLNICFDNHTSRGISNSNTCNFLSSRTVLIWVGTVTCEAFSLTERIWFCLYSSWIAVDDITSRSQKKHVKLSSKCNSHLSHERSSLFQCSINHFQGSKLSLCAVLSLLLKLLVKISR